MATYTQREIGGLVEITESAMAELKSSKYYNEDLAPTSDSERSWTTYSITMLWVGMSICISARTLCANWAKCLKGATIKMLSMICAFVISTML